MSKSTISTFQLFEMFPDQESARVYLEGRLWPEGPRCPVCGMGDRITTRKGGYYRCNQCKEDFTVRTGTMFERSHTPLDKWLYARDGIDVEIRHHEMCSKLRIIRDPRETPPPASAYNHI